MKFFNFKKKDKTNLGQLISELIGTFVLTKVVLFTIGGQIGYVGTLIVPMTLMFLVYTLGPISGSHLNPAITIGLLATKKIKPVPAAWYIIAQTIGATLAMLTTYLLFESLPSVSTDGLIWQILLGEFIGAFILAWGVYSAITEKTPQSASGLTVGAGLLVSILIASPFSNAILNPAVALGIGSVSVVYMIAPIIGAISSMLLFKYIEDCKVKV